MINSGSEWGGAVYTGRLAVAERAKLDAFYSPYNKQLYALIGRDLQWDHLLESASASKEQESSCILTDSGLAAARQQDKRVEL